MFSWKNKKNNGKPKASKMGRGLLEVAFKIGRGELEVSFKIGCG